MHEQAVLVPTYYSDKVLCRKGGLKQRSKIPRIHIAKGYVSLSPIIVGNIIEGTFVYFDDDGFVII